MSSQEKSFPVILVQAGLVCSRGVRCVNNTPVSAVTYQDFKKEGNMVRQLSLLVHIFHL